MKFTKTSVGGTIEILAADDLWRSPFVSRKPLLSLPVCP